MDSRTHGNGKRYLRRRRRPAAVPAVCALVVAAAVGAVAADRSGGGHPGSPQSGAELAAAGGTGGTNGPAAGFTGSIDWQPCEADPSADCGRLAVPVDWSDPGAETVDLFLTRRPAEDPGKRIGSLLMNTGGPGSPSGLAVLHQPEAVNGLFGQDVRDRFDVIGMDPRGVGFSDAIECSAELLAAAPDPMLESRQDFAERADYNKRLRADCRERNGELYDHVDTLSVAHDVEAVRSALGDRRLTYWGTSYGSLIGQQYAEEYPGRVRALALDSIVDHSLGTRDWVRARAESMESSFDEFADWCENDERCALNGRDVRKVWGGLLERAGEGEFGAPAGGQGRLAPYNIVHAAFDCFYGPEWSPLADYLHTLDSGGPTPEPPCGQEEGGPRPVEVPDPKALSIANFCSDYELPVADFREWRSLVHGIGRRYAPDARFSPNAVGRLADCLGLGGAAHPQHELDVSGTAAPLLLANARYDPITGYNQARNAARQIGGEGVLLTYEGWGHGAAGYFSGSDCVTRRVEAYLIGTEPPAPGASCPAVPYEPE